jgi:hypothetical protein
VRRIRVSMSGLMVAVLAAALGLAALRTPTPLSASLIFTMTVVLMATATLQALAGGGLAKRGWTGMAVFGWAYLGIAFGPGAGSNGVTPPPFPTMALYSYFKGMAAGGNVTLISPEPQGEDLPETYSLDPKLRASAPALVVLNVMDYKRTFHSLGAVFFGLLGAGIGRLLAPPSGVTSSEQSSSS